ELSQLESKKVGGVTASSPLQQIDYKYNIRGWMTQINDPANLGSDLFGYKINYNKVEGLEIPNADYPNQKVKPRYNGNIAEVSWKTLTEDNEPLKRYGYAYDGLNRLTGGFYQKDTNPYAKEYNELLAYDMNGNILNLVRTQGLLPGSNTTLMIDNLKYDYAGNKLVKVTDQQQNSSGYPYSLTPNIIGYDNDTVDGNGNMISHPDKGISSIQYNYLNLPKQITQSSKVTQYTYRADGVKVKKLFGDLETHYLDGFQYKTTKQSESSDSGIGVIDDPDAPAEIKLRIIPNSEGYYDALLNQYIYNYTDHLGNVRLSYTDTNKDGVIQPRQYFQSQCEDIPWDPFNPPSCISIWKPGEIVEVNNYYPFGLLHNYTATTQNAYQYKYQGQELQETGFYSFKWRNYMPDVGRFFNIDPLSEKYAYQSHYNFSENRVVDARELEGLEAVDFRKNDGYKNLVVVVQGWSGDTKKGYTQSQNVGGSNNPDFKGKGNLDLTGIGGLVGLANSNTRVVVFDSSQNENTKNDLKSTISNFNNVHSDGVVAAVGHSLGGDNLVESVNENKNLKVDLMVTLDIMDSYSDTKIPSNVSKAINYYQTKNIYGGEKIEPTSDNKTTKIVNVLAPTSDHKSIDNDLSTKVRDVVKRELIPNQ
ncbi:RHS repeat-associated core domain-containing protein, partial [Chryseobacterium sp.]|uniref:RHS repeat domain-containing protein n=1 Tax=Chryseobacterium sp. TaxID=1871047 RepID=UPI0023F35770